MKRIFCVVSFLLMVSAFYGCKEKSVMDTPVKGKNFEDFTDKLQDLCDKVDNKKCSYINGIIYIYFPDFDKANFTMNSEQQNLADNLLIQLNGKTPNEIIEIYKKTLIDKLKDTRQQDEDIIKNLDDIQNTYEKTKNYANDIAISDISVNFSKEVPELDFSVSNNTDFHLKKVVAEAEFYTQSDTFLGREPAVAKDLNPMLKKGQRRKFSMQLSSISEEDMVMIKAAKNLKIKVLISSVQTDSPKDNESTLVLALPYSYFKMRGIIKESDQLYNDTVKKINAINVE